MTAIFEIRIIFIVIEIKLNGKHSFEHPNEFWILTWKWVYARKIEEQNGVEYCVLVRTVLQYAREVTVFIF